MYFQAEILARDEEGLLERILRVMRCRGYGTHKLRAFSDLKQKVIHIQIEGESERSLQQLSRQIEKIYDVIEVTVGTLPVILSSIEFENQLMRRPVYGHSKRG